MADAKTKKYRIEMPYFRNQTATLYPGGSVVEIPADEKPSRTWVEVKESAPVEPAKSVAGKPAARVSDKDAL